MRTVFVFFAIAILVASSVCCTSTVSEEVVQTSVALTISAMQFEGQLNITSTQTPLPSITSTITPTPTTALTPTPTNTLIPLTYADIEYNKENMTALQWDAYRKEIINRRVHWVARVDEVTEDGELYLDMGEALWHAISIKGIPKNELLNINIGATIEFEATITDEFEILFWYLELGNPTIISVTQ